MNKFAKLAMVASALLIPHVSNAALPSGTLNGIVDVYKGVAATCDLTLDFVGSSAYVATSGNLVCDSLVFYNNGYAASESGGVVTLTDVYVKTYTVGDCRGDLEANWDGSVLDFDTTLPAVSGPDCFLAGYAM